MKKGNRLKLAIGLIIVTIILLIGLNYWISFDKDNVTQIIVASIIAIVTIFTATVSSKTNKEIDGIKINVKNIDEKVHAIDNKMIVFDKKILNIEDQEIAWKNSLKEIESGKAQSEQRQLYIFSHVQHTVEINELCVDIDAETNDYFDEKVDLDKDLKDFIIEVNGGISNIIKNQYERGFKKFKVNYFKSKLLNNLKACTTISLLETRIKDEISKDIKENICKYTNDLKLILANKDNGQRREEFIKTTLRLTEKINKRSLDKYNKFQIKTA